MAKNKSTRPALQLFRGTQLRETGGRMTVESWTPCQECAIVWSMRPGNPFASSREDHPAKFLPTSTIHAATLPARAKVLQLGNPETLQLWATLGDVMRALRFGEPNGMTEGDVRKVLTYLNNRVLGKTRAPPEFLYRLVDEDGDPVDEAFSFTGSTFSRFRDEEIDFDCTPEVGDRLLVETFALADAPAVQRVAAALGFAALRYWDTFMGVTFAAEAAGIDPDDVADIELQEDLNGDHVPAHETVRPLVPLTPLWSKPVTEVHEHARLTLGAPTPTRSASLALPQWAYHATTQDRLSSIRQHGLVPGATPRLRGSMEPNALFFSDDLSWVQGYGSADTYLRFPHPSKAQQDQHPTSGRILPHQFLSFEVVPPQAIEILQGDVWTPLLAATPARSAQSASAQSPGLVHVRFLPPTEEHLEKYGESFVRGDFLQHTPLYRVIDGEELKSILETGKIRGGAFSDGAERDHGAQWSFSLDDVVSWGKSWKERLGTDLFVIEISGKSKSFGILASRALVEESRTPGPTYVSANMCNTSLGCSVRATIHDVVRWYIVCDKGAKEVTRDQIETAARLLEIKPRRWTVYTQVLLDRPPDRLRLALAYLVAYGTAREGRTRDELGAYVDRHLNHTHDMGSAALLKAVMKAVDLSDKQWHVNPDVASAGASVGVDGQRSFSLLFRAHVVTAMDTSYSVRGVDLDLKGMEVYMPALKRWLGAWHGDVRIPAAKKSPARSAVSRSGLTFNAIDVYSRVTHYGDTGKFKYKPTITPGGTITCWEGQALLGIITWSNKRKVVSFIAVDPARQREGLATELWKRARALEPSLRHAPEEERTDQGSAWALAVDREPAKSKQGASPPNPHPYKAELHHGTHATFDKFRPELAGKRDTRDSGFLGRGTYFSSDARVAEPYPIHLRAMVELRNPLRVTAPTGPAGWEKHTVVCDVLNLPRTASGDEITAAARARGHDGVIYDYSPLGYLHQEVVVFDATGTRILTRGTGIAKPAKSSAQRALARSAEAPWLRVPWVYHVTPADAVQDITTHGFMPGWGDIGLGVYFFGSRTAAEKYAAAGGWDKSLRGKATAILAVQDPRIRLIDSDELDPSWSKKKYADMWFLAPDVEDDEDSKIVPAAIEVVQQSPARGAPAKSQRTAGILSKSKRGPAPEPFYHVTTYDRAGSIMAEGLLPGIGQGTWGGAYAGHVQGKVFISQGEDAALSWFGKIKDMAEYNASERDETPDTRVPVVLRVNPGQQELHVDPAGDRDVPGSFYVTETIPPTSIRYWNPEAQAWSADWDDAPAADAGVKSRTIYNSEGDEVDEADLGMDDDLDDVTYAFDVYGPYASGGFKPDHYSLAWTAPVAWEQTELDELGYTIVRSVPDGFSTDPVTATKGTILDVDDLDDAGLFHVTTNLPALLAQGFKSRKQLRQEGRLSAGLGGGPRDIAADRVSLGITHSGALRVLKGVRMMAQAVHGEISAADAVEVMLQLTDAAKDSAIGDAYAWSDFDEDGEDPGEALTRDLDALLDKAKRARPGPDLYTALSDYEERLSLALSGNEDSDEICLAPVGFTQPPDVFALIDPQQVGLVRVAIREGTRYVAEVVPSECEVRMKPEDVVIVGVWPK